MSVIDQIVRAADGLFRAGGSAPQPYRQVGNPNTATQRDTYTLLRALYYANDLYGELARTWRNDGESWASIKELRTVQAALVEAYVALTMPGNLPDALPLEFDEGNTRSEAVAERIQQVWSWSNWAQRKQLFIRQQAMLGNAFIYVASRPGPDGERADRVYFHLPEPEHVTDIDTDERGFLTYYRSDVPVIERDDPDNPYVVTEEWWKGKDLYRRWETPNVQYDAKRLGTPALDQTMTGDYGLDFVPVVHAKHRDTGDTYGMAPIIPALEKQHELNRKATAFSQQLYRHGKPDMVLQGAGGQTANAYQPPPTIREGSVQSVDVAGEMFWTVPPGYTIGHLIANVNYTAHMAGIEQDIAHLATSDLPELNWYRLSQSGGDVSGRALQTLLKPAIAKIEEARGNAETALARADAMALTIGQWAGLKGFDAATIGTYEDGSYDHQFTARSVIPMGENEQGEIDLARVNRVVAWTNAGLGIDAAMELEGYTDAEIEAATAIVSGVER